MEMKPKAPNGGNATAEMKKAVKCCEDMMKNGGKCCTETPSMEACKRC